MEHRRTGMVVIAWLACATCAVGQNLGPPLQVPPPPPVGEVLLPPPPPPPPPPHANLPPPLFVHDDAGQPAAAYDPFALWNGPCGVFVSVEADLAFPEFTRWHPNVETASLNATVIPDVSIGYRFGWGGSVLFRYRLLETTGSEPFNDPDVAGLTLNTRLQLNTYDIDYRSPICGGAGGWGLQYDIGVRIADWLTRTGLDQDTLGSVTARNRFVGAGPHLGLAAWRKFDAPGLAAFAKVDGAMIFGRGRQSMSIDMFPGTLTPFEFGARGPENVPYLNVQVGLSWARSLGKARFQLDAGYLYEEWWLETSGKDDDQALFRRIGWRNQGPFIRMELGF